MDADGKNLKQLTNNNAPDEDSNNNNPEADLWASDKKGYCDSIIGSGSV
jgi:hypothetical protein